MQLHGLHRVHGRPERRLRLLSVEPGPSTEPGLVTVTVLYPVDCPITARVQLLADALAA